MTRMKSRFALLLTMVPFILYAMFVKLPDFYSGIYETSDGREFLHIRSDHTGVASGNILPYSGNFKWRLMPDNMNMLYLYWPDGQELKLWLGEQASENGFSGVADNTLLLVKGDENSFSFQAIGKRVLETHQASVPSSERGDLQ